MKKIIIICFSFLILASSSSKVLANDQNKGLLSELVDNFIQFFVNISAHEEIINVKPLPQVKLVWPVEGESRITQGFHYGHPGIDIQGTDDSLSSAIVSVSSGVVMQASSGWNGGYGNVIVINHGNSMQTRYSHLKDIYVFEGQQVSQGQKIGWMGNSGLVHGKTGIHTQFEVIVNKVNVDPLNYY